MIRLQPLHYGLWWLLLSWFSDPDCNSLSVKPLYENFLICLLNHLGYKIKSKRNIFELFEKSFSNNQFGIIQQALDFCMVAIFHHASRWHAFIRIFECNVLCTPKLDTLLEFYHNANVEFGEFFFVYSSWGIWQMAPLDKTVATAAAPHKINGY